MRRLAIALQRVPAGDRFVPKGALGKVFRRNGLDREIALCRGASDIDAMTTMIAEVYDALGCPGRRRHFGGQGALEGDGNQWFAEAKGEIRHGGARTVETCRISGATATEALLVTLAANAGLDVCGTAVSRGCAMTYGVSGQSLTRIAHLVKINLRYLIYYGTEWINDRRYGIDTRTSFRGTQSIDDLTVVGDRSGAHPYAPTPFATVERVLKRLPADTSQYTFIDYGSGKGRVLLIAARHRFLEVIGIEFAEELHRIAERNIASFKGARRSPVRSVLCDATTFELPPGPCVLFIYNSFEGLIMKRVADNVISSYLANPRHIMVVYYNPTVANAFEAGGHFHHTQTVTDGILSGLSHPRRYAARILEAY